MHCAIVEFQYGDDFDPTHLAEIARQARGGFEGMPGVRQKAFTVDEENRRATQRLPLGRRRTRRARSSTTRWSSW